MIRHLCNITLPRRSWGRFGRGARWVSSHVYPSPVPVQCRLRTVTTIEATKSHDLRTAIVAARWAGACKKNSKLSSPPRWVSGAGRSPRQGLRPSRRRLGTLGETVKQSRRNPTPAGSEQTNTEGRGELFLSRFAGRGGARIHLGPRSRSAWTVVFFTGHHPSRLLLWSDLSPSRTSCTITPAAALRSLPLSLETRGNRSWEGQSSIFVKRRTLAVETGSNFSQRAVPKGTGVDSNLQVH